jgi:16S rRNA (guanine1207-N2)-methyltransferase
VRRPDDATRLRPHLSDWRRTKELPIGGTARAWVSYPGIFADGRIDEGTALLLANLPPLPTRSRVLDYGCGSGIIGATALAQQSDLALTLIDNDTVALEAARENVAGARFVAGTRIIDAGRVIYDAILSNPPLHTGLSEDHAHLERLVADAPTRLASDGLLLMVVQRRIPLDRMLGERFASVAIVAETGSYRVWRAVGRA